MRVGDSFSRKFEVAGKFAYFCKVHGSSMTGTITVVNGASGEAAAASTPEPDSDSGSSSYGY